MNKKRISNTIETILNRQVENEAEAAQTFLAYAIWADSKGFSGVANLLFRHSGEERSHMMKFIQYIQKRGGKTKITTLNAPAMDPTSLQDCFQQLFKHETKNTEAIYEIVALALQEKDWATWNFAQWFVKEQIEEETLIMELLDKLELAGGTKASSESLLLLDTEIGNQEDTAKLARDTNIEEQ